MQVWGNKGENSVLCRVEGGWRGVGIGELIKKYTASDIV